MTPFPRDDYRSLEPYAPDRSPVEVDLSDNTNRWGPHPAALAVLRSADPEALTRYPSVYADDLRRTVAARFGVDAACVTTGCGSDDLLDSLFRAVSGPGARVAYVQPTFSMIPIFARMNGLEAVGVPWSEAKEQPERLLRGGGAAGEETEDRKSSSATAAPPDLVYVCSPNNPTGEVLPEGWLETLLEAGGPSGPVVALDEAYVDFAGNSWLREAPETDRLVVLRTLSKAYGLAGLRVGFAVGPEPVVAELQKARGPYKVGRIDEAAAIAAVEDADGWVTEIVETTLRNRARLASELAARGFAPLPSGANFLLVPVGPEETAAGLTAILRERGVAVRPFPGVPGVGEAVRVTVGPWPLVERFLEALDEALSRRSGVAGRGRAGRGKPEAGDAMAEDDR